MQQDHDSIDQSTTPTQEIKCQNVIYSTFVASIQINVLLKYNTTKQPYSFGQPET